MKKIILFISAVFLIYYSGAGQMNSGSFFSSGTTGLDLEAYSGKDVDADDKSRYLEISFQPRVGYFIKNRIAIGGAIMSALEKSSEDMVDYEYSNTQSTLILGPFGRYYFECGSLIPFVDGFLGFGRANSKFKTGDVTTNNPHSIFKVAAGGGADYMINEKVAIEAILQYFREKEKPSGDNANGGGQIYSGIMMNFGIVIFFGSI
jgi:hypothetical protein